MHGQIEVRHGKQQESKILMLVHLLVVSFIYGGRRLSNRGYQSETLLVRVSGVSESKKTDPSDLNTATTTFCFTSF